ncbi:MAG: hypothetical protein ACJA2G_003603 [Cognaticolwellia sp.]|jgi:hypothetical protein
MAIFKFTVVKGHQVASGRANDPRFPSGTISAQLPFFQALGLDLNGYYLATINAQFNCHAIVLNLYDHYFKQVKWHENMSAENFKFCRCYILANSTSYPTLIYQPQLDTKIEHLQPINQLELLAPFIEHLHYGDVISLVIANAKVTLFDVYP